jgi:hypothetical protein
VELPERQAQVLPANSGPDLPGLPEPWANLEHWAQPENQALKAKLAQPALQAAAASGALAFPQARAWAALACP